MRCAYCVASDCMCNMYCSFRCVASRMANSLPRKHLSYVKNIMTITMRMALLCNIFVMVNTLLSTHLWMLLVLVFYLPLARPYLVLRLTWLQRCDQSKSFANNQQAFSKVSPGLLKQALQQLQVLQNVATQYCYQSCCHQSCLRWDDEE